MTRDGDEVRRDLAPEVADPRRARGARAVRRLGGLPWRLTLDGAYMGRPFDRWSLHGTARRSGPAVELPRPLTDIRSRARTSTPRCAHRDLSLDALGPREAEARRSCW